MDALVSYSQRLNGMTNTWIRAGLGTTTRDFNEESGLMRLTNGLYTLWREENFKRFYRRDFLQLSASTDLVNGLTLGAGIEYNDNSRLVNHSTYSIIDRKNKEIQPNVPDNSTLDSWQLENHQSFISRVTLEYTPRHRYRIKNHTKIYADSKFPTFSFGYNRAYSDIFGSDARYDEVKLGIRQKLDVNAGDQFSYVISMGKFINSERLYFEDFRHFNTQSTNFLFARYDHSFRLLPFYLYSTGSQYAEVHTTWQSWRLILKQLPLIKNSSVSEKLFINYLATPNLKNYVEAGYGIDNIFLLLNVEAVAGFENGKFSSSAIKVSLNLSDLGN